MTFQLWADQRWTCYHPHVLNNVSIITPWRIYYLWFPLAILFIDMETTLSLDLLFQGSSSPLSFLRTWEGSTCNVYLDL